MNSETKSKRIIKNTVYLYLRMLFTVFINLYSARVVLNNLGVEDFGVYNVVGGIVTFMSFITATLASATQRFLAYDLGKGDVSQYERTFSMLLNIFFIICVLLFFLLEAIGPIYIFNYLKVSPSRLNPAFWVFEFSLFTFLVNTMCIPFRSSIIAHEKMGVFAFIGIVESIGTLGVAIVLPYLGIDRLLLYGLLMMLLYLLVATYLVIFCRVKLSGCVYIKYWNKDYFKKLSSYAGWNLFGSITGVMDLQGQALVLNYFFGPVINAAKSISDRVNGMISQFSTNFYMAVAPQIIKSYAEGDIMYTKKLVLNSSRYSYFLLFVISAPLYFVMQRVLELWLGLGNVSLDMVRFCECTIIYMLVNILEQPLTMANRATGDIKKYQVSVGIITLSFIPLCIILFLLKFPAYYSMILLTLIYIVASFFRVHLVAPTLSMLESEYYRSVITPILLSTILTFSILAVMRIVLDKLEVNWIVQGLTFFLLTLIISYLLGFKRTEKEYVYSFIKNKVSVW